MRTMQLFWAMQSTDVRLIVLVLFAVVFISVVRFVRLAWRLYQFSGEPIRPEKVARAVVDPERLAKSALANRLRYKPMLKNPTDSESSLKGACGERILYVLRGAESTFMYLWDRCQADVDSTKRASVLTLLLACVIVSYGAYPTFEEIARGSRITVVQSLYLTLFEQLIRLAVGLTLCAMLYMVSSFFERALADRKACWKYFCGLLKNEVSGE